MNEEKLKDMYIGCIHDPTLDHLTNSEYLTLISEPQYTVVISLIGSLTTVIIRYILTFITNRINLSERTVRRLNASITHGNLDEFKFIYNYEYMQSRIINWFEFDEPLYDLDWNFYPLCECWGIEPIKINRCLYVLPCRCSDGKRYIAFKTAYDDYEYDISSTHESQSSSKTMEKLLIVNYIHDSGPILIKHQSVSLKLL